MTGAVIFLCIAAVGLVTGIYFIVREIEARLIGGDAARHLTREEQRVFERALRRSVQKWGG